MNRFSSELKSEDDQMYCKTILVRHIPPNDNIVEELKEYFLQEFPDLTISGIQLISDVRQLDFLEQSYTNAANALRYAEENNINNETKRYMIRPYNFSQLFCCCNCNRMDAANFYENEMKEMEKQIYDELQIIPTQPFRSAFITFEKEFMAMKYDVFFNNNNIKY